MDLDDGEGDEDVAGAGAMLKANAKRTSTGLFLQRHFWRFLPLPSMLVF